jgi:hypothetical protein
MKTPRFFPPAFSLLAALMALTLLAGALAAQPASKTKAMALNLVLGNAADPIVIRSAADYTVSKHGPLGELELTVGKTALVLEDKAPQAGAREVRALLRLRNAAAAASADFRLARKDPKALGLRLLVSTAKGSESIQCQAQQEGKPLHDLKELGKGLNWEPQVSNDLSYYPRAYSAKDIRKEWPADVRARIERDMTALPSVNDRWLEVRIQVRPGEVRFWLDDHLVAHKRGPDVVADGLSRVELSPGVQLAGYKVLPWPATPGFLPVRLAGYANGRAFIGGAGVVQPAFPKDEAVTVGGVPFLASGVNPEGTDHIDVGRSLYRQANLAGYMPSYEHRWIGSARRDPRRIQLRIPNGQYDTLYLLAAASGEPAHVPLVTAQFYRPSAGFAENFESEVPLAIPAFTMPSLPVALPGGKRVNLWLVKVPLDPGRLSAFSDMDIVELELTKKVHQFRSYPDPFIYGWHQGGPPSSVHIFGLTLGEAPVGFKLTPDRFGHVWTAPALPAYTATLQNSGGNQAGKLTLIARSHDGTDTSKQQLPVQLGKGETKVNFSVPVKLNGYHDLTATLEVAGRSWTEKRSFVRLAPDTRATRWTQGKGALFGYWSYHGGHHTPKAAHHVELMTAAGARTSIGYIDHPLVKKHWAPVSAGAWEVSPQPWADAEPPDAKKYAAYQKEIAGVFAKARAALPAEFRPDHVYFFPEPHISQRLTEGNLPTYWNEVEPTLTPQEKKQLRTDFVTAKAAAEAVRANFPGLKVLVPWGDPLFVPPLLRAGFPKQLIDGSGLDIPGFERLPEMQLHHIALHRLYTLRKEFEKAGIPGPQLQYCEGIFVPTEPGAVTPREQMDIYNRWALVSMAHGVNRFYSGWFAFDCGNYYGSEHYGGCGIQRRIPYCDPKPAYAAYATMTDKLDQANFAGWLRTGSLSTYCLHFKGPKGNVYVLWTLRGQRPVTLTLAAHKDVFVTDAMNNSTVYSWQDPKRLSVTIPTGPSVVYVTGVEVVSAMVGEPDHGDASPARDARLVADLGDGSWKYSNQRDQVYEKGHYSVMRYPGKFNAEVAAGGAAPEKVLRSRLEKQDKEHPLMPWYNILVPAKPIPLPGAPSHLGLWVRGASDWGRVIYVLRDATGEKWTSIGTQDEYNCDDLHSWSAFCFDGWRYLRFELPGHAGYDSFRKHGTTWWRSDGGDGIVDLPLSLEAIIVEQRTNVLYVNDVQPAASDTVHFGKMYVEYAGPDDATAEAVRVSRLRMPAP